MLSYLRIRKEKTKYADYFDEWNGLSTLIAIISNQEKVASSRKGSLFGVRGERFVSYGSTDGFESSFSDISKKGLLFHVHPNYGFSGLKKSSTLSGLDKGISKWRPMAIVEYASKVNLVKDEQNFFDMRVSLAYKSKKSVMTQYIFSTFDNGLYVAKTPEGDISGRIPFLGNSSRSSNILLQ
jgi:hypothetical protein